MTYVFALDHHHGLARSEVVSLIGSKAANLGVMARELELPVPPGFVISTAACRRYLAGDWPSELDAEIERGLAAVSAAAGRGFGDPANPLLLSVRSGAPVSMPGMMDTILNLGLNEEISRGLVRSTGDAAFVDECNKRFVDMYQAIAGGAVPHDPWLQLRRAIQAVFRSWNSDRARSYRGREGIADDLCTGVIVQAMVFGNRGGDSAAGVLFTRNPATGENAVCGDVICNAQGEDVVAGTHRPESIAFLDDRMPAISAQLRAHARRLEMHYADMCDIEFTIERGKLWLLQTRVGKRSPQAALRIAAEMAEDSRFPLTREEAVTRVAGYLGNPPRVASTRDSDVAVVTIGLAASPGVAAGEIATTAEDAVRLADTGKEVVLVRRNTSPNDVHGMACAAGILTATGGLVSHAAVVARGWGIPAVVGVHSLSVAGDTVVIGSKRFRRGDVLTINGNTGEVFAGTVASGSQVVREAQKLLSWANELGIEVTAAQATSEDRTTDEALGDVGRDDVVHVLLIKGLVGADDLANILFTTPDAVIPLLDALVADGLVGPFAGGGALGPMFQLTDEGRAVGTARLAVDRERWGDERAAQALDDLLPLDLRIKEILGRWQLREIDGRPVVNDHSDTAHDASVLASFRRLHHDATVWLRPLVEQLPRLRSYLARLERAVAAIDAGDTDYLVSPRCDSYHNVWFELHEDLILLAGRTRQDEITAGRA